jgi:hypothetical protein
MSTQAEVQSAKADGSTLVGVTLVSRFAAPILVIAVAIALALINTYLAPALGALPVMESFVGP